MIERLRGAVRRGRVGGAGWVRALDALRALGSEEGRAALWTRTAHRGQLHQTSGHTEPERYPDLFDLAARKRPDAARVLSFGCSTGEELQAIRRRFAGAEIVGAEINPRSRRIARERMKSDGRASVVAPQEIAGRFDLIFAMAVLQVQPHRVADGGVEDLSAIYPFERFDAEVTRLVELLAPVGLLCVFNAHYRVEDSLAAAQLMAVEESPALDHPIFGRDGKRLAPGAVGRSLFRKA